MSTGAAPSIGSNQSPQLATDRFHATRAKRILHDHPEVRDLIGRNPWTALAILVLVATQLTLAWLLGSQPWWVILLIGYSLGSLANHSLYVMFHEATHDRIFRRRVPNLIAGIVADIPNVVPAYISFRIYHIKHHSGLGVYELDADVPNHWETRLVGNNPVTKALWLFFFPVFQLTRPPRLKNIRFMNRWTVVNWIVVFATDVAILLLLGPGALLYLAASFFFSIGGLNPLSARWIQEHFQVAAPQETYSYYGPVNYLNFNIGYHNEHHDFPSIPWNLLPKLRRTAPEYYDTLACHDSYTRLMMRFIFDSKLSLASRPPKQPPS